MSSLFYPTSFENEKYKAMPTVQSAFTPLSQGFKAVVVVAMRDDPTGESSRYSVSGEFDTYRDALLAGRRYARELIDSLP
jgi:hypothetical protein